jgi:CBS domain-containing protein
LKDQPVTRYRGSDDVVSKTVREAIRRPPVSCAPETPLGAVLQAMHDQGIGSMVVVDASGVPLGIFTVQDVLSRVALAGAALDVPVASLMTTGLVTLEPEAGAYEATLAMAAHGIHHVLVVEHGRLAGVISERDLLVPAESSPRVVSDGIRRARDPDALRRSSGEIRRLAQRMLQAGTGAAQVTRTLSTLNDVLSRRIIEIEFGAQPVDAAWCWISMGSEGRVEQTFSSDQDNGIIFAADEGEADAVRERLLPIADRINKRLDECGFALCRGNIMASSRECCLSVAEWKTRFASWIERTEPAALLNVTIFFDFRPLAGDAGLARELRAWLAPIVADDHRFLVQLTRTALENQPPLGLVRDFVFASGAGHRLDLKVNGVTPFVDAGRVFALAAGVTDTNTLQRLRVAGERLGFDAVEIEAWEEAYQFIQLMRLREQDRQLAGAKALDNRVDPDDLNDLDRRILRESMRQARKLQDRLAHNRKTGSSEFGL